MWQVQAGAFGLGWMRDNPDVRDYTAESDKVLEILSQSKAFKKSVKGKQSAKAPKFTTPGAPKVDLRAHCSPIENQGSIGSCTAQAGVGLLEYFEKRGFKKHINGSRRFLYKVTRNLLGWTGDTGAYLRTTMKAMVLFGVPPESYWEYSISNYNDEPTSFVYSLAQNFQATKYFRLDPPGTSGAELLAKAKLFLSIGFPSMFGFTVYDSIWSASNGEIPYPSSGDRVSGGHAVVAIGYDDNKRIDGRKGALLIRNSWGTSWGDGGYGWLPFDYVRDGLAVDFWSLIHSEFVDTELFT